MARLGLDRVRSGYDKGPSARKPSYALDSELDRADYRGMDIEWVRGHCLSLPYTTEQVQWGDDLVFKVGGKMFAVAPLEPRDLWLSFKCGEEEFSELIERAGIIPAPYLARAKWVALESDDALSRGEIERLLRAAHDLVFAKLPKKLQEKLNGQASCPRPKSPRRPRQH